MSLEIQMGTYLDKQCWYQVVHSELQVLEVQQQQAQNKSNPRLLHLRCTCSSCSWDNSRCFL